MLYLRITYNIKFKKYYIIVITNRYNNYERTL